MKKIIPFSIVVGALLFLVAPGSAQMTPPGSAMHSDAGKMQTMMPECSAMMKEFMADPIVQKRMMAIMQKHMMQHSGQKSMMMPATTGTKPMQSGSAGSDSSAHEAHHGEEPASIPIAAPLPSPIPSP